MLDGYKSGDKLTLAYVGMILTMPTERGCEPLFRLFNAPWERPDEYAGPSMSVGDVVTFFPGRPEEASFACDKIGFIKIVLNGNKIEARPARWIRNAEQLRDYRKHKVAETEGHIWVPTSL